VRGSWKYLEAGVHRIMINLQEGIDMQTVSISPSQKKSTDTDLGLAISSIWEYTRKYFVLATAWLMLTPHQGSS